jgi:hypothetical protein
MKPDDSFFEDKEGRIAVLEVFVNHYDKNNKITTTPEDVKKTKIFTYEMLYEKNGEELLTISEPGVLYDPTVINTPSFHYTSENKLNDVLKELLFTFYEGVEEFSDKEIDLKISLSTDVVDYTLSDSFVLIANLGYVYYNFDLAFKDLLLPPFQYNFKNFYMDKAKLTLRENTMISSKSFTLLNSTIVGIPPNEENSVFAAITIQSSFITLENIKITKDNIVNFIFDGTTEDEVLWRKSYLRILGLYYDYTKQPINHLINSLIKCVRIHTIDIIKTEFLFEECGLHLISIKNSRTTNITNLDAVASFKFTKNLIIFDDVAESKLLNVKAKNTLKFLVDAEARLIYLSTILNTTQLCFHKFLNVETESLGLIKGSAIVSKYITIMNCKMKYFSSPIVFEGSSFLGELKILNTETIQVDEIQFDAGKVSIFNSILPVKRMIFVVREKLFLSVPEFETTEEIKFTLLGEAPNIMLDKGVLKSKNITVMGNGGVGKITAEGTRLEAQNILSFVGLEKVTLKIGRLIGKTLNISSTKLSELSCALKSSALEEVTFTGCKIDTSEIRLSGTDNRKIVINLEGCTGFLDISSEVWRKNITLNMKDTKLHVLFYLKETVPSSQTAVTLTCDGVCLGSSVLSTSSYLNINPQAVNENFKQMKRIFTLEDRIEKTNVKEKITFGTVLV